MQGILATFRNMTKWCLNDKSLVYFLYNGTSTFVIMTLAITFKDVTASINEDQQLVLSNCVVMLSVVILGSSFFHITNAFMLPETRSF